MIIPMRHDDAVRTMATERYFLGELSDEERDAFEAHYFDCVVCAADVQAAADLVDSFRGAKRPEPPCTLNHRTYMREEERLGFSGNAWLAIHWIERHAPDTVHALYNVFRLGVHEEAKKDPARSPRGGKEEGDRPMISEKTLTAVFPNVTTLFRSKTEAERVANILDEAYANGVGHPEYHKAFTLDTDPQMVAMNLAGLYAADTTANILAATESPKDAAPSEQAYLDALRKIASGNLSATEKYIAKNIANATWRAGQPFRDLSSKPLDRITRDVNQQFNLLPPDEEDKDLIQVRTAANLIIEYLTSQATIE